VKNEIEAALAGKPKVVAASATIKWVMWRMGRLQVPVARPENFRL
jgi:hypothetical protein